MILRPACWSIFLSLALQLTAKAQVEVVDQGFQNLLISFAPNVPSENGKELIFSIQDLLENTSSVLRTAIGIRIATVTFHLPPSWPVEAWENITVTSATLDQTSKRPDIRVDATELSPFGKQPVALQHGGCGVVGHQIILPLDFVSRTDGYPKGKLLAREWLKYRYGVFEENGFAGDSLYPDYYRIPGNSDIRITECTDSEVTYNFKRPVSGDECDMSSSGDFGFCKTHPDGEAAANVTSSLMYYHQDLINMEHICGKDGHPHHNTSRNKQNALCNGQSVWDVVKLSKDFENIQPQPAADPDPAPIQFSYIQESKPRFVVLLEDSDKLYEKENSIRFALKRFYYDLPPTSRLAISIYNQEVTEVLAYTELTGEERKDLGDIALFGYTQTDICTSCGLTQAMQILLTNSEVEKGSILLMTASPLDTAPEISDKIKSAGICLNVLRVHAEEETLDASYEPLRDSFPCFSYEPLQDTQDELQTFDALSGFLRTQSPKLNEDFEVKSVASGSMSAKYSVTIPQDPTASLFTLWLGKAFNSDSIECKSGDTVVKPKPSTKAAGIASFTFDPMDDAVTCKLGSTKQDPVLTEVQMTTQKGQYFDFDVWYHDVSTKEKQEPIIVYAKIYFGGYPVNGANARMVVTSENKSDVVVKMFDNGRGDPDVTQHDGIYSGYFTDFITAGDYHITVKIDDDQGLAKIGKLDSLLRSDTCCGSKINGGSSDAPAFDLEKHIEYNAKNKRPEDGYPPSRIVDLQAYIFNISDFVFLTWTAPGGGKVGGYELKLFQKRENAVSHFDTTGHELNGSDVFPGDTGKSEGFVLPVEDLEEDTTYYVTMRSFNEFNKKSDISNVAEFFIETSGGGTTGDGGTSTPKSIRDDEEAKRAQTRKRTIEIVVGVLAGIVVLCILVYLVVYFFVQRPRRKEEKARARKKAENGGGGSRTSGNPSGQIGLNSIPADVIIKHHNEVVEAKNLHKDPPIFNEESLDSFNSSPDLPENSRRNNKVAQYTMVQRAPEVTAPNSSQQDPSKSPKRMTVV